MTDALKNVASEYLDAGLDLIPLVAGSNRAFEWDWTERPPYSLDEIVGFIEAGHNIGFRIRDPWILLDVDVKGDHKGKQALAELRRRYPELKPMKPICRTPSGGAHYLLRLPDGWTHENVAVHVPLGTWDDTRGLEFLHQGQQAVIGGSFREDYGKTYEFLPDGLHQPITMPVALCTELSRKRSQGNSGPLAGLLDADELGVYLDLLSPVDFRDHTRWVNLAMACHHATNGAGEDEFVAWCMLDPVYEDHEEIVRKRWESFSTDKDISFTARYLLKELKEEGHEVPELASRIAVANSGFRKIEGGTEEDHTWLQAMAMVSNLPEGNYVKALSDVFRFVLSKNMTAIEREDVINAVKNRLGTRVTKVALRQEFNRVSLEYNQEQDEGAIDDSSEERMIAEQMIEEWGGPDKILFSQDRYWVWGSSHYQQLNDNDILHRIDRWLTRHRQPNSAGRQRDILFLIKSARAIDGKEPRFWENPWLDQGGMLNLLNGELWETDTGWTLRPHDPVNRQRTVLDLEYVPSGTPKVWMKYLDTAFAEDYDLMTRRLACGLVYTLMSGRPWLKKAWTIIGPSNTGKSKLLDLFRYMVGQENATGAALEEMNDKHGLDELVGMRANFQTEVSTSEKLNPTVFKKLTSNDYLRINPKGGKTFSAALEAILWIAGNDRVQFSRGNSSGVIERIVEVRLTNALSREERDPELLTKLVAEKDLILTWALDIWLNERKDRFAVLELDEEEQSTIRTDLDPDVEWFKRNFEVTGSPADHVYNSDAMIRYAEVNSAVSPQQFAPIFDRCIRSVEGAGRKVTRKPRVWHPETKKQTTRWRGMRMLDGDPENQSQDFS